GLRARSHPRACRSFGPAGEPLYNTNRIPSPAPEAKAARLNATMPQIPGGHGAPLPLGAMRRLTQGVHPKDAFLFSTVGGTAALRDAWAARVRKPIAPGEQLGLSRPAVTYGMTHGLAVIANLFVDEDTTVW